MGKDLPKPHSWLVTELDFTHMFWLPVRSPFPPHSLVPSRYHLLPKDARGRAAAKCLLSATRAQT